MRRAPAVVAAAALVAAITPARAQATAVAFNCGGSGGIESMENEYILTAQYGGCWFHTGHHTYDAGGLYRVGAVTGSLFSVEVELSPPTDLVLTSDGSIVGGALAFEASADGLAWTTLHQIPWALNLEDRKGLPFTFDRGGFVARYFRIRQPRSAAQGLSGFLDAAGFTAMLEPVASEPPAPAAGTRTYDCLNDIMERFFEAHPCTFGGINRYDSPSVFHTYPIGPSSLERIAGTASFLPWRTDDYHFDGGGRTNIAGWVQTSVDGVDWTTVGAISGTYGAPISFDFAALAGAQASYVRLVGELMKKPKRDPSLKHVRGMLAYSSLELTGTLA